MTGRPVEPSVLDTLLTRAAEPSTWRGLVWVLSACGIVLVPEQSVVITAAGAAVAGAIGVITGDRPHNASDPTTPMQNTLPFP